MTRTKKRLRRSAGILLPLALGLVAGCGCTGGTGGGSGGSIGGILQLPPPQVRSVVFSPDGKVLAAGVDKQVKLWDAATGEERGVLASVPSPINCLAFDAEGRRLGIGEFNGVVRVWDVAAKKELLGLEGHKTPVTAVAFAPDGQTLASAGGDPSPMRPVAELKLWDLGAGKLRADLPGHGSAVWAVAFDPGTGALVSAGQDSKIKVWDLTDKPKATDVKSPGPVACLAFAPDGKTLATGHVAQSVRLWDTSPWKERAAFDAGNERVNGLAFAADGRTLASVNADRTVSLCDVPGGKVRTSFQGHRMPIVAVAFRPDASLLATGSTDGTVIFWDAAKGEERLTLR